MRVYLAWLFLFGFLPGPWIDASEELVEVADLKADFEMLYRNLQQAHVRLYANITKADMDREYAIRLANIKQPLTLTEAKVYFQRFVSLGKIAHTRIDLPYQPFHDHLQKGGTVFPLNLKVKRGQWFITANDSGLADIRAGDQLVAMNGMSMKEWSRRLAAYVSADTETMLHGFFETRLPYLMWLEIGEVDQFELTIRQQSGRQVKVLVPARGRAFMRQQQRQRRGRLALDNTRAYRIEAGGIGYLRPGPFYHTEGSDPWDAGPFKKFIDEAFDHLNQQSVRALVIDIRDNPGGDNAFSDPMLAWFADKPFQFASRFDIKVSEQTTRSNAARLTPGDTDSISARFARAYAKRKPGDRFGFEIPRKMPRQGARFTRPVFLLINRHSYSNAVFVAATVQDYRFGTVIGEETNDLASSYGAMEQFALPHTGIVVGYPKAYIVRPNGDATIRGVVPDVVIETPLIETEDDPVLTRVFQYVQERLN